HLPALHSFPTRRSSDLMLALLITYYTSHTTDAVLSQLAEYKRSHGLLFVIVASITAGALIPELFLIIFFQRCRPTLRNLRNLLRSEEHTSELQSRVDLV